MIGSRRVVRSFGWPPARYGNGGWKKDEAMKEVKRVWPELE